MHIGKSLARLNPKTSQFTMGSGGVPDLTPQDIAAALAFVKPGLGRELICRIWWPAGAALTAADLDELLMTAQLSEWRSRMDKVLDAQLVRAYAKNDSERSRASAALDRARALMWPRLGPEARYAAIRLGVLEEMSSSLLCKVCRGRGSVIDGEKIINCPTCDGSGHRTVSDRYRAKLIGRDVTTYKQTWAPVYEWTLELCELAIAPAHAQFRFAVS